jgi:hypothetical protein
MIPIVKEPTKITDMFTSPICGVVVEKCHFCGMSTLHWNEESNTPVCQACSLRFDIKDLYF